MFLSIYKTAQKLIATCYVGDHLSLVKFSGSLNRVFQVGMSMAFFRGQTRSMMKLSNAIEMH